MPVPVMNESIQACIESWTSEQQLYTQQLGESLASLEAYQQHLDEWQQQLEEETKRVAERQASLERERRDLLQEQADDAALAAELQKARAEIEALRAQFLQSSTDPSTPSRHEGSLEAHSSESRSNSQRLEHGMNSVAKQFQKLRNQQVARRGSPPPHNGAPG